MTGPRSAASLLRAGASPAPPIFRVPADATRETAFRCTTLRCTMAYRACLARRAEVERPNRLAKNQQWRARHPFCAEECKQGKAVAKRFGPGDERVVRADGIGMVRAYKPKPRADRKKNPTGGG